MSLLNSLKMSQKNLHAFLFKFFFWGAAIGFYLLMFVPLFVVIAKAFSFKHDSTISLTLEGFRELFSESALLQAGVNSVVLGLCSACIAMVLGTLSAFTQYWSKNKAQQFCSYVGLTIIILLPEIALSIFLLGWLSFLKIPLGFPALLVAHTAFCIPFVAFPLWSQLRTLDRAIIEAAKDLGAKTSTIFFKIILPPLFSTLGATFLLCFFLSMDDVVISTFFASPNYQTLSLYVCAAARLGVRRHLNALATVLLFISCSFFWFILKPWLNRTFEPPEFIPSNSKKEFSHLNKHSKRLMRLFSRYLKQWRNKWSLSKRKILFVAIVCVGVFSQFNFLPPFDQGNQRLSSRAQTLYLHTWSEYFPKSILEEFYQESGYHVIPSYFSSNDELFAQLEAYPNVSYDLILPSSYAIPQLIATNKIQPFDKKFEMLWQRVEPEFRNLLSESEKLYAFPYLWGATGIGINETERTIPSVEINSWNDLWNPALKNSIFGLDDPKEMFYIARLSQGETLLDPKFLDHQIQREKECLAKLMPNIQAFSPPDAPHLPFKEEQAKVGILWNGSANFLEREGFNIKFVWPTEGALLWIDNFCLPINAQNHEAAFAFLSFVSRPEIAAKIVNLTGFPSPYCNVKQFLSPSEAENELLFSSKQHLQNTHFFTIDPATSQEELEIIEFQKLKLGV